MLAYVAEQREVPADVNASVDNFKWFDYTGNGGNLKLQGCGCLVKIEV